MDTLAKLFGSVSRMKVLRLVLFNRETKFTIDSVAYRARVRKDTARSELELLARIGLLRKGKAKIEGKQRVIYKTDTSFEHYDALRAFIRRTTEVKKEQLTKTFKGCGTLKLLVLSGTLTDTPEASIDVLIVGDRLQQKKIDQAIRSLEAELGQEIAYATFTTQDFTYRLGVYDRLIRDVLEYPHLVLVDKINISK